VAFRIRVGVPEMEAYWNDISTRKLPANKNVVNCAAVHYTSPSP